MKIGVIGAGSAGATALLSILDKVLHDNLTDVEIYCLHNPDKPPINVGEGTSSFLFALLHSALKFNFIKDGEELKSTLKFGTEFIWDEVNGERFFLNAGNPGLHIDSTIFSTYVIKKVKEAYENFYELHDNVESITQDDNEVTVTGSKYIYKFDYVVDCTGFASKQDIESGKNIVPEFISVNSVILYPELKKYNEMYSSAIAHKHGYMFGIPLTYRKTWGYLYNNKFTTEQEAKEDFSKIKDIDTSGLRSFSWTPSYRASPIDGRVITTGNKLIFLEPHGGTMVHYYISVLKSLFTEIFKGMPVKQLELLAKENHMHNVEQLMDVVALFYCCESKCNSKFWDYATQASRERLKRSNHFQNWLLQKPSHRYNKYWSLEGLFLEELIAGYKIDLNDLKR